MRVSLIIFSLLLFAVTAPAKVIFKDQLPVFDEVEILFYSKNKTIAPSKFCRELKTFNQGIKRSDCRLATEIEENEDYQVYFDWVAANLNPAVVNTHLKNRNSGLELFFQKNKSKYFIFNHQDSTKAHWLLIYQGGYQYPLSAIKITGTSEAALHSTMMQEWFSGQTQKFLSYSEEKKQQKTPNPFYSSDLFIDLHFAYGIGYTSGFSDDPNGGVVAYNALSVADSGNAWNWLEKGSIQHTLKFGGNYADFIGLETFLRYSKYDIRLRGDAYAQLNEWNYERYEVGILSKFQTKFSISPKLDLVPGLLIGVHYSFFNENFSTGAASNTYTKFDKFETHIGGFFGAGTFLRYNNKFGVELEGILSARGKVDDTRITADGTENLEIPGGSSTDYQVSLNFIYIYRYMLE